MGGGDLNLKKSWHPSTLRNIERVWKAEQKHEVEKQKIEQLQKELAEERAREEIQAYAEDQGVVKKREERLDWMYQGPAAMVNREDYLLGRKIDKTLELLEHQESGTEPKNDDFDIGSSMFSSQDLSGTATVDLANKIREDPLFSIMKKEKEQRKNLLSNPVKMKQLQQMLQESLKKGKKDKKRKRSKKHSHSDTVDKHHKKNRNSQSSHLSDGDKMYSKNHQNKHTEGKKTSCDTSQDRCHRKSSSFRRHQNTHGDKDSSSSKHINNYSREIAETKEINKRHKNLQSARKRKVDEEEREIRLKEMQENAKWREEQCKRRIERHRENEEREEKSHKVHTSDFVKSMLSREAGKGNLENRVKQKMFSIQRKTTDMDRHFARR